MNAQSASIQRTYLLLLLTSTLAASFIWGVNTLFLLDAGLNNLQAFAANAAFTVGQVLFEVPTGVVADIWGRRTSYVLGVLTLLISTLLYLYLWQIRGAFWLWAVVSALLGLGFTFFSGATEAWLVDALHATGYKGNLESVFAKGQVVGGIAMLSGSVAGGYIAQATNLGVPYIARVAMLFVALIVALLFMSDVGFTPVKSASVGRAISKTLHESYLYGLKNKPVRWLMLAAPFTGGVSIYAFYAMQPHLLKLYGNPHAYGVAGLAAAIVASAQIVGGMVAPSVRRVFKLRTSLLAAGLIIGSAALVVIGFTTNFWIAIIMLVVWALVFAASMPIRQAYINALIPSKQRATVLSFDSLMSSSGGVVIQPALGRMADVYSYGTTYVAAAAVQILALPFILATRRTQAQADKIEK